MHPRYDRVLHNKVLQALLPEGPFHFLISEIPMDDPYALDIHVRERNTIMYYHGTTRVLAVQFKASSSGVEANAYAAKAYGKYPGCQQQYCTLMRRWVAGDASAFRSAFLAYLQNAVAASDARYYRNGREGYWQNRLCVRYGKKWSPADEWLIFDRECVIGFDNKAEQSTFYEDARKSYQRVKDKLQNEDLAVWGQPDGKGFGDELDMLAINRRGDLVVIELKHGKYSSGIYWGPLQVGGYHHAFSETIGAIAGGIRKLVMQKIELGLLPLEARVRLDASGLTRIEPILAVAEPNEKSKCWHMMARVIEEIDGEGIQRPALPLRIARIGAVDNDVKIEFTSAYRSETAT